MKFSPVQMGVLKLLAERGHTMSLSAIYNETGRNADYRTIARLLKHQCVEETNLGWRITDLGKDALKTGIRP
jgi:hypothetical protein